MGSVGGIHLIQSEHYLSCASRKDYTATLDDRPQPLGLYKSHMIAVPKPMAFAILSLGGCAILFFGYDASVMSQVNINPDCLSTMGLDHGTNEDAARVGGLVSSWFAGFLISKLSLRLCNLNFIMLANSRQGPQSLIRARCATNWSLR